jgi:hypothetical protein
MQFDNDLDVEYFFLSGLELVQKARGGNNELFEKLRHGN